MATSILVEELLAAPGLELRAVAGTAGLSRTISVPRIQKPGLALAGHTEQVHPERVQILGQTEIGYLRGRSVVEQKAGCENLLVLQPACLVVTRALEPPASLIEAAERHVIPLLSSTLVSSVFIDRITAWLEDVLAPSTSLHGVLLDVLGVGILLLGKSGVGKSEAALDLVMRGHRLVADDVVEIRKKGGIVYGSGSEIIKHHMEIRGLGIINIKDLFGIAAVRDTKKVELVIELVDWTSEEEYDRLGLDELTFPILDTPIPMLRIPVRPGRNIASIIEVAARNQLLKFQGHYSAREFQEHLNRAIAAARPQAFRSDEVE